MRKISRISFVDRGDNPYADILILKRANSETVEMDIDQIARRIADAGAAGHSDAARHVVQAEAFLRTHPEFVKSVDEAVVVRKRGGDTAESVLAEVEKRARSLRDKEPTLTREQAFAKVWSSSPELRERYDDAAFADVRFREDQRAGRTIDFNEVVGKIQKAVAPGDPVRGLGIVKLYFPTLYAAWLSAPIGR